MGKTTNAAVQARERARARRLALEKDEQAQKDRIDEANADVIVAQDEVAAATDQRDAEVRTAQAAFDAAVTAADRKAAAVIGKAEPRIGVALRRLLAEKLSAARIAELTELPQAEVRRLTKTDTPAAGDGAAAVALAG